MYQVHLIVMTVQIGRVWWSAVPVRDSSWLGAAMHTAGRNSLPPSTPCDVQGLDAQSLHMDVTHCVLNYSIPLGAASPAGVFDLHEG